MKASRLCVVLACAAVVGTMVLRELSAQPAANMPAATKVAVCDLVQVFDNYQRAADLNAQLREKEKRMAAEDAQKVRAIENLRAELEGLKSGSDEYNKRLDQVFDLGFRLEAWRKIEKRRLLTWHHDLTKEMYEAVLETVKQVAQERGVHIVLLRHEQTLETHETPDLLREIARRRVLYHDERVDISDVVLARINQAYRASRP